MMACKCGLLNAVTFLTEHGANMALKDSDGYTALHHTCNSHSHHSITLLSYLIENGADINDCTNDDYTPLMIAAQKGDINALNVVLMCIIVTEMVEQLFILQYIIFLLPQFLRDQVL